MNRVTSIGISCADPSAGSRQLFDTSSLAARRSACARRLELKQPQLAEACAAIAPEHQVIDKGAVERLGGTGEPAGRALVAVARRGVAARMIVGEDDPGASVQHGVGDDRTKRKIGAACVAAMARKAEAVGVIVEMGDPEAFAGGVRLFDAAGKECARGGKAVELQLVLDAIVAGAVEEPPRNDPPISPAAGTCYLVGDSPTGSWAQYASHVAAFGVSGWRFVAPVFGLTFSVKTTATHATYGSGGWELGTVRASRVVVDGIQVVGSQANAIADPAGGSTVDAEARATLEQILSVLRTHGLITT